MDKNQIAIITQGPHLLFVGVNGHKTFGITVKNVDPEAKKRGYSAHWDINDYTILRATNLSSALGLTAEEAEKLRDEIRQLRAGTDLKGANEG